MSQRNARGWTQPTRRRVLAATGTAALTAVAGCSAVVDALANQVLREVNVFNQLDRAVSGSVTVLDPSGGTALTETFDLPSVETDGESNFAAYDDVWGEPGDYVVGIELEDTGSDGSTQRAEDTVAIEDTDEDMVGIAIGSEVTDETVAIRTGDSVSDFGWQE